MESTGGSSPGSLSNQQGIMENVQLFGNFSDKVKHQEAIMDTKNLNKRDTKNKKEAKLSISDQGVNNKLANIPFSSANTKNFFDISDGKEHITIPIKSEKLKSSVFCEPLDNTKHDKTLKPTESSLDKSLSDKQKHADGKNKTIVTEDHGDTGKKGKAENGTFELVDTLENSLIPVSQKEDKKRKLDEHLEKKFGTENKKMKLSNKSALQMKADVKKDLKKNVVNKERIKSSNDDIYSFEDEMDQNKHVEFSYESFDKNVLHKRKTSAKFLSSKKSKVYLELPGQHNTSQKLDQIWSEGKGDNSKVLTTKLASYDTVPSSSEGFRTDVTSKLTKADDDKKVLERFEKDNFLSKKDGRNMGIELITQKSKEFGISDNSSAERVCLFVNKKIADKNCDKNLPLMKNLSTVSMSSKVSDDFNGCNIENDVHENVNHGSLSEKTSSESVLSEGSKRDGVQTMPSCDKVKGLKVIGLSGPQGRSKKETNKNFIPAGKNNFCNNVVYNGVTKAEFGSHVAPSHKSGFQLSIDNVYGSPKVSNQKHTKSSFLNGFDEKNVYRGQKGDRFSGGHFLKPPFNGYVIDKRLEAIRKVSLWIGDCIDSASRMDSPEDLLRDKTVPSGHQQNNRIDTSLSEPFTASSDKAKCATSKTKCASSKALLKTKCAENLKLKCEVENANEKEQCSQNVKPRCETVDGKQNVKLKCETVNGKLKCQQDVKEISAFRRNVRVDSVEKKTSGPFKNEKGISSSKPTDSPSLIECAKDNSKLIAFRKFDEKSQSVFVMDDLKNAKKANGVLDLKLKEQLKERSSVKMSQPLFNSMYRMSNATVFDSNSKLSEDEENFLNRGGSQQRKAVNDLNEPRYEKLLHIKNEVDLKNDKSEFVVNGTKQECKGDLLDLRQGMSRKQHRKNIEQIEGFDSSCVDLSIKNLDVSHNKLSDKVTVDGKTVESHYGAEIWGFGNDLYTCNIQADLAIVNNVKHLNDAAHVKSLSRVNRSSSQVLNTVNNVKEDIGNHGNSAKLDNKVTENITGWNSKDCNEYRLGNSAKLNSNITENVIRWNNKGSDDYKISGILQNGRKCVNSAGNRNVKDLETISNKSKERDVNTGRRNNDSLTIDDAVNTANSSDTSSFGFTPDPFNHTYPLFVVNMNKEAQNEPLDLHVDIETAIQNANGFNTGSAHDVEVKNCAKKENVLLKNNVGLSGLSVHDLNDTQSQNDVNEVNKDMPKDGESQNIGMGDFVESNSEKEIEIVTSPQSGIVKSELTNGFANNDWSAEDLASLGLDNLDEDHSLDNINPVSIVDCPVSFETSLVSVNGEPVNKGLNPVSTASHSVSSLVSVNGDTVSKNFNSVSSSSISFSPDDSFSDFPVNGNQVSNDGNNSVSNTCNNAGNQFPNIIENTVNQFPNFVENTGNQFSNIGENTENRFPNNGQNEGNHFSLDDELIGENEDYQWNETLKSFIMQNLENEPKGENGSKEPAADVKLLLEQKLAEQYLNRNIESLKRKHSVD